MQIVKYNSKEDTLTVNKDKYAPTELAVRKFCMSQTKEDFVRGVEKLALDSISDPALFEKYFVKKRDVIS